MSKKITWLRVSFIGTGRGRTRVEETQTTKDGNPPDDSGNWVRTD